MPAAAFTPACDREEVELLQILLENGASVNYPGGECGTVLKVARDRLEDKKTSPNIWNRSPEAIRMYWQGG